MRTHSSRSARIACAAAAGAVVVTITGLAAPARGETFAWTGASTVNGNWSTPVNWHGNAVPVSGNTTDIVCAVASRTAMIQDLGQGFTVRSLWFSDNPYTLTGNSFAFDGAFASIHNSTTFSINTTITLHTTISYEGTGNGSFTNMQGPGGFIKNGTGTVTMNSIPSYTGGTVVNAGRISIGSAFTLMSQAVTLNGNDGLSFNGLAAEIGSIAGTGSLNLGTANIAVGGNGTSQSYSGQISATTGGIEKRGAGTWTLTGAGSSFQRFSVSGGHAVISGVASMTLTSTDGLNRALTVGGTSSAGNFTVQGGAALNTLAAATGTALIRGASGVASTATVTGAGSQWDASRIDVGSSLTNPGTLVAENGGVVNASDLFVGNLEGGRLLVQNTGLVTTARLQVGGGPGGSVPTVSLRAGGRVNAGTTTLATPSSVIELDRGTLTTSMLTGAAGHGSITLRDPANGPALVIIGSSGTASYGGAISGGGGVLKLGSSTQTLAGQNTYTGLTEVHGGTLVLHSSASSTHSAHGTGRIALRFGSLGHSSFRVTGGGTIEYPEVVIGGFLRGNDGTHDLASVASFNGTTFGADTVLATTAALALNNVVNSGNLTAAAPLTWDGGANASAGRFTVDTHANVSSFANDGVVTIRPGAVLTNLWTNLVSGGGSSVTIEEQGALALDSTALDLRGSLLVNNGAIDGTTNVYFGALAAGAGQFGDVVIHPGGAYTPGVTLANAPAPAPVTTGLITPLDANQSTSARVNLAAHTTADVPKDDGALTLTSRLSAAGKTLTKAGGGTLALASLRAGGLVVEQGDVVIVPNGGPDAVTVLNGLSIGTAAGARLALNDNDLVVDYTGTSVEAQVRQWVRDGRARGPGITTLATGDDDTTLAVADNAEWGKSAFNGIVIDTTTVVGKYTYFGDANLDGKVTGDDYVAVDANLGTGDSWLEGDFNMNGVTTGDDYVAIDANLGKGTPTPLAFAELKEEMVALHVAMFGEEYLVLLAQAEAEGFGATVVPEPAAACVSGFGALLLPLRRRRVKWMR